MASTTLKPTIRTGFLVVILQLVPGIGFLYTVPNKELNVTVMVYDFEFLLFSPLHLKLLYFCKLQNMSLGND